MRIMNWNIEHMNSWWTSDSPPQLRDTFAGSAISPAITDVPDLASRVANVICGVDPDVITIQEGAGSAELDQFFNTMVDTTGNRPWQLQVGKGAQALAVAARLDRGVVTEMLPGPDIVADIDLTADYQVDIEGEEDPALDPELDDSHFARKPQPVLLRAHGADVLILNNHLKSKFVNRGEQRWLAGGEERRDFIRDALVARRRISAEAYRIREYLDRLMDTYPNVAVLVTGDLNDGPGSDFFEEHYLTHSVVDRVFGSIFAPDRRLCHALLDRGILEPTAQFFDFVTNEIRDLFLDHIGLSKWLNTHWTDWTSEVEHTFFDANSIDDPSRAERDQHPSDHRPVVVDLEPADSSDTPDALASGWALAQGSLFKWQRNAIGTPLEQALLADDVKNHLADRAAGDLAQHDQVSASRHEDALEAAVRGVVVRLSPTSVIADVEQAVIDLRDATAEAEGPAPAFQFL